MPNVTVARAWAGQTAVCIGGGPSLTIEDVEACRGRARVIAINDGYRLAPWADILYAADVSWWRHHKGVPSFAGDKYSIERNKGCGDRYHKPYADIRVLRNTGRFGLETEPDGLKTGMNSGAQAIGLAFHLGVSRILLLGYDCKMTGGESHWFGHHPPALQRTSPYTSFANCFAQMAPHLDTHGVEVVNCSRETALTCFRRSTIDVELPMPVEVAS